VLAFTLGKILDVSFTDSYPTLTQTDGLVREPEISFPITLAIAITTLVILHKTLPEVHKETWLTPMNKKKQIFKLFQSSYMK
jgi:hypothetical protein